MFCICMGYNGKVRTIFFMLKIKLLRHKVGLCLHGHIDVVYRYCKKVETKG